MVVLFLVSDTSTTFNQMTTLAMKLLNIIREIVDSQIRVYDWQTLLMKNEESVSVCQSTFLLQ